MVACNSAVRVAHLLLERAIQLGQGLERQRVLDRDRALVGEREQQAAVLPRVVLAGETRAQIQKRDGALLGAERDRDRAVLELGEGRRAPIAPGRAGRAPDPRPRSVRRARPAARAPWGAALRPGSSAAPRGSSSRSATAASRRLVTSRVLPVVIGGAEEDPVDGALHQVAHGQQQSDADDPDHQREELPVPRERVGVGRLEAAQDSGVERGDARREQRVADGAADQHVDLEQVVAQRGVAERDREEHGRERHQVLLDAPARRGRDDAQQQDRREGEERRERHHADSLAHLERRRAQIGADLRGDQQRHRGAHSRDRELVARRCRAPAGRASSCPALATRPPATQIQAGRRRTRSSSAERRGKTSAMWRPAGSHQGLAERVQPEETVGTVQVHRGQRVQSRTTSEKAAIPVASESSRRSTRDEHGEDQEGGAAEEVRAEEQQEVPAAEAPHTDRVDARRPVGPAHDILDRIALGARGDLRGELAGALRPLGRRRRAARSGTARRRPYPASARGRRTR